MNIFKRIPHGKKTWMLAAVILGTIVASSGTSDAGLVLTSSSGSIGFGINTISATGLQGAPKFNADGSLASPGGGLPVLQGNSAVTPTQFVTSSSINPSFASSATTSPSSPIGNVPSIFGTASTEIYASASGSEGSSTPRGGVFWSLNTTIADNLGSNSTNPPLASVSLSMAKATFTNTGTTSVRVTPGSIISVIGTLGTDPRSFVGAGLSSSYTLSGGGVTTTTTTFNPIVLAASRTLSTIASYGTDPNGAASMTVGGGKVFGTGSTFNLGGQITLVPGESIALSAVLTLISDPGSSISISSGMAPGFPTDPSFVPDFGINADAEPLAVPEPSTIVLLGAGLTMAGLWARRSGRRRRPEARASCAERR